MAATENISYASVVWRQRFMEPALPPRSRTTTSASNIARPATTKIIETRTMETQTGPIVEDITEATRDNTTNRREANEGNVYTD